MVDIPANPNAAGIVLYDENDKVITLSDGADGCPIRLITNQNNIKMKEVALKLGLPEAASEAEVLAAVTRLQDKHTQDVATLTAEKVKAEAEVKRLNDERIATQKAEAVTLVDGAVKSGKISAELKDTYLGLFEKDFEGTKRAVLAMSGRQSLGNRTTTSAASEQYAKMSWDELDKKDLLGELKENDPDLYRQKFEAMSKKLNISK